MKEREESGETDAERLQHAVQTVSGAGNRDHKHRPKWVARKYGIQSETTVKRWLEKYGTFDWENIKGKEMPKRKEQEIMELRQKLLLLEKKNSRLEKALEDESVKATIFDIMIDIAEKEYKIDIRKTRAPGSQTRQKK